MSAPQSPGFLARWSQRKALARQVGEAALPAEPECAVTMPEPPAEPVAGVPQAAPAPEPAEAPPTLADVAELTPASDFSRFVAEGVHPEVKNAALKTLFADPHFNVMDGLDTYIDDYSVPSPLPASMLKKMAQARFLGLVTEDPDEPPPAVPAPTASATDPLPDEDPDLRLQPHDAAGREGPGPGAGEEPRREP
ncbi:DUF3306 domain-containing protein [Ideonella sp. YS5]|uniref:DUF3306 domain-containing protein n=1 Tax=Ideonella sp. YS5 TaxID=3453714 RepID=UPI003EE92E3B